MDDDGDGVHTILDSCPTSSITWTSDSTTDYDGDGCRDSDEDDDDDGEHHDDDDDDHPRHRGLVMSVQLDDGRWLNASTLLVPRPPAWTLPSITAMGVTAVALVLLVILLVRRMTRPLAELAIAAEAAGVALGYESSVAGGIPVIVRSSSSTSLIAIHSAPRKSRV